MNFREFYVLAMEKYTAFLLKHTELINSFLEELSKVSEKDEIVRSYQLQLKLMQMQSGMSERFHKTLVYMERQAWSKDIEKKPSPYYQEILDTMEVDFFQKLTTHSQQAFDEYTALIPSLS